MSFNIHPEVLALYDELVSIRREIHKNPEILFDLPKTTKLVSDYLKGLGMEVHENIGISGVVGVIQGNGPCILLRADMDALPLLEINEVDYKSTVDGKMHACGHDAHTAMLLVAAKVIWNNRHLLKGSVKFMFQPAEEGGHGALKMIEDPKYPILDHEPRVDEVYGIHVINNQMIGNYLLNDCFMSCFADFFSILITGKGGHMSAETLNPINIAAEMINALQNIVARNIDNNERAVFSVTSFVAGDIENAVPETCSLKGTFRSLEKNVRDMIISRIEEISKGFEVAYRCKVDFELIPLYPPIKNSRVCVDKADEVLKKISPNRVRDTVTLMIGEDFSYLTDRRPGAFVCLGTGTPNEVNSSIHSTSFNINERSMLIGSSFFVNLILEQLA